MPPERFIPVIKCAEVPEAFTTRKGAADFFGHKEQGIEELSALEHEKLLKILGILDHQRLKKLVLAGNITLGIIKPNLGQSLNLPKDEDEAREVILGEIGRENIVFDVSVVLSKKQAESFYKEVKEKYETMPDPNREGTIWDSIMSTVTSGPLTYLLIYREEGHAVRWWRERMGSTNPDNARKGTIRRQYATSKMLPNNIVHGSESIKEVMREIAVLREVIFEIT